MAKSKAQPKTKSKTKAPSPAPKPASQKVVSESMTEKPRSKPPRGAIPLPEEDILGRALVGESGLQDLDIDQIRPDPNQGRWILPTEIRAKFQTDEIDAAEALTRWRKLIERLAKQAKKAPGEIPEGRKLGEIEALAKSIRSGGQVNPITVVRAGDKWRIETGERRWWAHQWLVHVEHDESARKVPAIVRSVLDPFRQAVENLHAAPLNAVGTARTIGRLILALSENPAHGRDFEEALDWASYRQLADARLPHRGSEKIQEVMGKSADYIDRHRRLLLLPPEALELADRNDLNERQLRPITQLNEPAAQTRVVELTVEFSLPANEIEWVCKQPNLALAERQLRARLGVKAEPQKPPRAQHEPARVLFDRVSSLVRLTESVAKGGQPPAKALADMYVTERGNQAETELRSLLEILQETLNSVQGQMGEPALLQEAKENTAQGRNISEEAESERSADSEPHSETEASTQHPSESLPPTET